MVVLLHSFLGVRTVVIDHVSRPRARVITLSVLYLVAGILFILGTIVVATLEPKAGVP
jgi:succinate dehydrogenase hydrophobic anchor subunit